MNIDPVDFFTGYEMYNDVFCNIRRPQQSFCKTLLSQFLVILTTAAFCGAGFYYYQNVYLMQNIEEDTMNSSSSTQLEDDIYNSREKSSCENKFGELHSEINRLKEEMENTNMWRKHLDGLFTNIYLQQDSMFEKKIEKALDTYSADIIGMYDFAALYAGGAVVATPGAVPYPTNRSVSFFNLVSVEVLSSPDALLEACTLPGCCFAFRGGSGRIRIKLGRGVEVRSVTLDHASVELVGKATSAPKEFQVYGLTSKDDGHGILLGQFTYDIKGRPQQNFEIKNNVATKFEFIDLNILSNYGKEEFTCIYRFRVHNDTLRNVKNKQKKSEGKCRGGCD